ncbi:unnamed protein product [Adineta steineri]|uniref:histone acetyltransferase n=1 Tax=Adineta steineri TaxID=433720 RepID=A0A813QWL0_9BILA|nr:unnamed protein product [Adineta steineri]CAF1622345.1 unnamed protein product [Adineta steineri]
MNNNNNNTPLSNRCDSIDTGSILSSIYSTNSVSSATTSNINLPNHSLSQQTPSTITSELDSSVINNTSVQQNDQRRQIIQHLALLLHAHKCLQRERQAINTGDNHETTSQYPCPVPHCTTMRTVLQHMTKCSDFKNCPFTNCVQSRHIILHWKNCQTPNCFLCGSLRKPSTMRSQNPPNREWQQLIHQDHRSHLVKKVTSALLGTIQQDSHSLNPDRVAAITNYAQKTEADAYNAATSHEDYFQRLAERIYRIQKEYDEKQSLKRQQATTITSIDRLAGEQGPPNRIAPQIDYPITQIKTEPMIHHPPTITTVPLDKQRGAADASNRLAVHNNNSNVHTDTNGNHSDTIHIKTEEISFNHDSKNHTSTIVKKQDEITMGKSFSNSNIEKTTVETIKSEMIDTDSNNSNNRPPIDATSKSLPKYPAVFSPEDIREKFTPILRHMFDQEEGFWFRQPVTEAIAPGYFDIIKCPMDFSTIFKKLDENQYPTPFKLCEDIWLVFNNTWAFNKKTHRAHKAGVKLADIFMENVDPIMQDYGYCCGRQYVFLPPAMFCYGIGGICCTIPRDGDYFYYKNPDSARNNLSGDKYTFCKKCFDSVKSEYISVGDDPAQTLVELPKCEFIQAKNDHQEPETVTDCIVCSRRFHNICVLYHEHIWPEGYVCKLCTQQYNVKRKENRYLAHKLTMTDLANTLEKRVNDFLRKECDFNNDGRVTIRVLAASDRICEVKPRLKNHFGSTIPDGYPYRTKAIFAFQEIDGVDVVLFGMHVQEYDSRCPAPNTRRVYISYLDSVHYFRPKQQRTALYYEILIGYLEYVKQLGFVYAHIWACPPSEGDDYIFHCHPVEQRVPKPKRLQEWYKTMLDMAVDQRVVVDYKDIVKDCTDSGVNKATDLPYFEGDFWTSTIEELIKEIDTEEEDRRKLEELEAVKACDDICFDDSIETEEPTELSDKRKSGGGTTHKKKNFKKTTSQRRTTRKNMTTGSDLITKIYGTMEKHKESFFVVRLRNLLSISATLTDTDPLIQCDLMESRDAFLNFAREKHCEFSSLRRAKYSTMVSLIELHSSTADKMSHSCNSCRQQCDIRYHCTICDDYDLCNKCITIVKHEHRMDRLDEINQTTTNSDTPMNLQQQRQATMQKMVDAIRHAIQCRNANCIFKNCSPCKRLLQHVNDCTKLARNQCQHCSKLLAPIWFHTKTCTDQHCPLPFCQSFKHKIQRQRAATMQADRRRIKAMHRANIRPAPSPLTSQNTEPTPTTTTSTANTTATKTTTNQYHSSMESASPSSSGKMMPSGGKSGKPSSINGLVRTNLLQPPPSSSLQQQQHPAYYNGGTSNSIGSSNGYPMTMTHSQPPSQQWMAAQQPNRYASHGGKPMNYGQQRMPYPVESYIMRPQTPQIPAPSSDYPYTPSIAQSSYSSYPQPMDTNPGGMIRTAKPMLSQPSQVSNRYPVNAYYNQPTSIPYQQQQPQMPSAPHRSFSQNMTPNYPTTIPSNGTLNKPNIIESIELKSEDSFDDLSKLQVPQSQQQQQMFYPMLQSRSRAQSPSYYPTMPPTNNSYYSSQRSLAPSSEYNMSVGRGVRVSSVPPNTYGTLPVQQRVYGPPSANDLTIGLQSTPSPSVNPH